MDPFKLNTSCTLEHLIVTCDKASQGLSISVSCSKTSGLQWFLVVVCIHLALVLFIVCCSLQTAISKSKINVSVHLIDSSTYLEGLDHFKWISTCCTIYGLNKFGGDTAAVNFDFWT